MMIFIVDFMKLIKFSFAISFVMCSIFIIQMFFANSMLIGKETWKLFKKFTWWTHRIVLPQSMQHKMHFHLI